MTLDSNIKFLKMLYSKILWPAHETYELHKELTSTLDIEVKKVYIAEISEYILKFNELLLMIDITLP